MQAKAVGLICNFKNSRNHIQRAKKGKINFHIFHLMQYIHSVMMSICNQYEVLRTYLHFFTQSFQNPVCIFHLQQVLIQTSDTFSAPWPP